MMTRPKEGDEKKCPRPNCDDNVIFSEDTIKPGTGAAFADGAGPRAPQRTPAWFCLSCGYYEPISS